MSYSGNVESVNVDAVKCKPIPSFLGANKEERPEILEQMLVHLQRKMPSNMTTVSLHMHQVKPTVPQKIQYDMPLERRATSDLNTIEDSPRGPMPDDRPTMQQLERQKN